VREALAALDSLGIGAPVRVQRQAPKQRHVCKTPQLLSLEPRLDCGGAQLPQQQGSTVQADDRAKLWLRSMPVTPEAMGSEQEVATRPHLHLDQYLGIRASL